MSLAGFFSLALFNMIMIKAAMNIGAISYNLKKTEIPTKIPERKSRYVFLISINFDKNIVAISRNKK